MWSWQPEQAARGRFSSPNDGGLTRLSWDWESELDWEWDSELDLDSESDLHLHGGSVQKNRWRHNIADYFENLIRTQQSKSIHYLYHRHQIWHNAFADYLPI
jgi:hypothetical protein